MPSDGPVSYNPFVSISVGFRHLVTSALLAVISFGTIEMARAARSAPPRAAEIRRFANRWMGTPYQWGGTSRSGIDCSAYLRQMYRDLFAVELPRTTKQQIHLGVDLSIRPRRLSAGLEPGDLIFYVDRGGIPNHVVVYAGDGKITHSVSGRGVVMESIAKLHGRRVIGRRLLLPSRGGGRSRFAAIPAAPPAAPVEIPCPPSYAPRPHEVRKWARTPIPAMTALGTPELCEVRLLGEALANRTERIARANATKLEAYAAWLESLEALGEVLRAP